MKRSLSVLAVLAFSSCAFADSTAFIATGSQQFGTVDLNTGSYTQLGSLGFVPAGLGQIGDTVYTALGGGMTLYSVNLTNGATTAIGNGNTSYFAFGSTTTGLFMFGPTGVLYSVNPASGAMTAIGSTLINVNSSYVGLSAGGSNLFITVGQDLYSVNPSVSTTATLIGTTGIGGIGALVSENGHLFGTSVVGPNLSFELNQSNASSTYLASLYGTPTPDYAFGLAPNVPEPATLGLCGLAGVLLGGYAIRRRRLAA